MTHLNRWRHFASGCSTRIGRLRKGLWGLALAGLFVTVAGPIDATAGQEETVGQQPSDEGGILLNFDGVSLSAVLEYLSESAGLTVVLNVPVDGRVSVVSRQPLTVEEAVALLNTALKEQGYAAIRMGRILKIVPLSEAKVRNIPVRTGNDPNEIEPTDDMITQVIPIRYADAVRLREDLASLIPSYAEMSANASSNSLILTDTGANVRKVVEIVQALDTHMSTVAEVVVFQLSYADGVETAKLINEVFKEEEVQTSAQSSRQPLGGRIQFMGPGRREDTTTEAQAPGPKVNAVGDDRTNTLVVRGPRDTLQVVAQVVNELDANPAEQESILVYELKYAQAENLKTVLNDLFSQTQGTTGTTGGRTQTTTGRTGSVFGQRTTQSSSVTQETIGGLSGQVYVVADEDTNSLIIMTAPENFGRIRAILADLDKPIPQVLIKVLIAEVTHGTTVDLGIEFSVLNIEPEGSELFTDFDVVGKTEGLIYKLVHTDVSAALRALEEVGKLDVLSRPYILASNNQPAVMTVGERVPFISNTRTTETGQTINTITYEDIGIILEVTPHINSDGLVIMDIYPEVSTLTTTTVPISEDVDATVYAKRSAESRVAVRDGQTIVIGGLVEDRKTGTVRKVPLLGDIPLLGMLFRRTIDEKEKTELLIFLTPHVAHEPSQLTAMSEGELAASQVVGKAVEPGAFDAHIQSMRRTSAEGDPGESGRGQ